MHEHIRPYALSPHDHHLLVRLALNELPNELDQEQLRRLAREKLLRRSKGRPVPTRKAIRLIFGETGSAIAGRPIASG